jgi:ankyrin repeat protein
MEELLISSGSKVNIKDEFGRTPLFYAFVKIDRPFENFELDPFETVSSLCALRDCEVKLVDDYGMSPLHYAA